MPPLAAFAVAAPGLAPLVADELRALGITPGAADDAGVAFDATPEALWRANLWLRTASRVLVRLAAFEARTFFELERHARRVPWETIVAGGGVVRLRVTCRKSRLYHSDAVAQRVVDAVARRVPGARVDVARGAAEDDAEAADATPADAAADAPPAGDVAQAEAQLLVVRFLHDHCTISADSSGALLHRRGYRQAVGKAPLRETLAAGLLLGSGYDGSGPLVDPLCGSGTIPIEAALIARRLAPGRARRFAFEHWPAFDAARWAALRAEADEGARPHAPHPILGSDRDEGAIAGAVENAGRAGVAGDVAFSAHALSDAPVPERRGPGGLAATAPSG
jgi:putative N6-adenine-specific DNA methylase